MQKEFLSIQLTFLSIQLTVGVKVSANFFEMNFPPLRYGKFQI